MIPGYFTVEFTNYFNILGTATGGGGGHGSKGGNHGDSDNQRYHYKPTFGFYADQLRRQQMRVENGEPKPKLNWIRHRED